MRSGPTAPSPIAVPIKRSPAQVAREAAAREVDETLLNIETAIRRADRARRAVGDREPNFAIALRAAITELEATRKALFQATYFSRDQHQLI